MKNFSYPFLIYLIALLACLCIMLIIDYLLGNEAEYLNAWVILNRLIGNKTPNFDSLAIRYFGLAGATFITIFINGILGVILIKVIHFIIHLFHA